MDNTTFGGNTPTVPQWTGPARAIVHVQAMLYASLAASFFSALLAMLGKQWLNRYASTDMRGTAIERSQDRQRKLDGVVTWYFDCVMESLPLILQFALLLLGCALSRYLWEINVTVACVVISVTALGVVFYAFFLVAGTASESCPYQTPGTLILRHTLRRVLRRILPYNLRRIPHHVIPYVLDLLRYILDGSTTISSLLALPDFVFSDWSIPGLLCSAACSLGYVIYCLPVLLAYDVCKLVWVMVKTLVALARRLFNWLRSVCPPRAHGLDQRTIMLDLRCISWILQTSLDKGIHLSTLKFLGAMTTLADFNPTLVINCFDILLGCVKISDCNTAVTQGFERLAEVSVICFFHTYSHLSVVDPTSSVLADIRQRYVKTFPPHLDISSLPLPHTFCVIHRVFQTTRRGLEPSTWKDYKPSDHEHAVVARALVKLSQYEYQRRRRNKVPRWILRYALHALSQDPPPPTSATASCLLIIAIDLGCDITDTVILEERYVHILRIAANFLTKN